MQPKRNNRKLQEYLKLIEKVEDMPEEELKEFQKDMEKYIQYKRNKRKK